MRNNFIPKPVKIQDLMLLFRQLLWITEQTYDQSRLTTIGPDIYIFLFCFSKSKSCDMVIIHKNFCVYHRFIEKYSPKKLNML